MHTDSKKQNFANNVKGFKFPLNMFLVIVSVAIVVVSIVAYSFQVGYQMSVKYAPLVDAAMEIKLEATFAHLAFEEIILGKENGKIQHMTEHLDNSEWYANVMLEGGENSEGRFMPLTDPFLRQDIKSVLGKLNNFRAIAKERYLIYKDLVPKERVPDTLIHQKYDTIFSNFIETTDFVETELQKYIASDQGKYRSLQYLLLVTLILVMTLLFLIFCKYERQGAKDLALIRAANDEVKILSGFIPICASCKQIRDDEGFWGQVEDYITDHSEAKFSHGICPECMKKLYPDYTKDAK